MSIEIKKFRPFSKNTLTGFLNVELTAIKLEIRDLTVHQKGEKRWLGLPSKQYEKDGKTQWMPVLKFTDTDAWYKFQEATFKALDQYEPKSEPQ